MAKKKQAKPMFNTKQQRHIDERVSKLLYALDEVELVQRRLVKLLNELRVTGVSLYSMPCAKDTPDA